jgi:SAM-dependent methyltransferase
VPETPLVSRVVCPLDRAGLHPSGDGLACPAGHHYGRGADGYLELAPPDSPVLVVESTGVHTVAEQESGSSRVYQAYLRPWLDQRPTSTVLDVGCGVGTFVAAMRDDGIDALGVDMRGVTGFWAGAGRDREGFAVADATTLPFPDDSFDVVTSLGVVEHVGTLTGHLTLAPDWKAQRRAFAAELERVTRPGGRVLLACPNKWFPVDVQHGPSDQLTAAPRRTAVFNRFKVNIHPTWGAYHLASYADLWSWYGRDRVHPLPLQGYFGFAALDRPGLPAPLARLARRLVDDLPAALRPTPLNPYLLAQIDI